MRNFLNKYLEVTDNIENILSTKVILIIIVKNKLKLNRGHFIISSF